MYRLKQIALVVVLCHLQYILFAQNINNKTEEPTDFMNSNGKIYVVAAVVVTIVLGIFIYLLNLDRKITKIEKDL